MVITVLKFLQSIGAWLQKCNKFLMTDNHLQDRFVQIGVGRNGWCFISEEEQISKTHPSYTYISIILVPFSLPAI